jgi:hypothetical protein
MDRKPSTSGKSSYRDRSGAQIDRLRRCCALKKGGRSKEYEKINADPTHGTERLPPD